MRSTGNDIVALQAMDIARASRPGFYSKFLTEPERVLYRDRLGLSFEEYVWLCWSVKESAYKYFKRLMPELLFSPSKFVIECVAAPRVPTLSGFNSKYWENAGEGEELYTGIVSYGSYRLQFKSKINADWLATVVDINKSTCTVRWCVQYIEETGCEQQSAAAKALLLNALGGFNPGQKEVEKSSVGYPVVVNGGKDSGTVASLAHDGHYVSYSFLR